MRILMIAADRMEFAGFRSLEVRSTVAPQPGVEWSGRARVGENEFLLAANGVGRARASAAVDAALRDFPADAIVSTGFCGALSPELCIADVVVGTSVTEGASRFPAREPRCDRAHHKGVVVSIDHVAQTAAEKSRLHGSGGAVVEMEAAGIASRATALGAPFYCVRVVTDLAGEDMANDFNRALRGDGHFATMNILAGTLRKPLVRLPELFRLRRRCVLAARVLGEFIADCRFRA